MPGGGDMRRENVDHERFGSLERLYGPGTLVRLAAAHVAVVGVGGVGSWAAEALARSGVGAVTLIDADDVCLSNTNRQSHTLAGTIGRPKVEVIAERLRAINPALRCTPQASFLTPANIPVQLDQGFDAVLDACDAFRVKVETVAWCRRRKLAVVVCGSAGGRTDPTLVTARDLSSYAGSQLAGGLGGFLGRLGSDVVPFSSEPIPVRIDAAIRSNGGQPELQNVAGSVAGVPAGPLASAIAAAVADRL